MSSICLSIRWSVCIQWVREQYSRGQHGAHLGPVGPRWAPCWPQEPCYQGNITSTLYCEICPASDCQSNDQYASGGPGSKIQGANMGPIWVLSAPYGPHVGSRNLAIRVISLQLDIVKYVQHLAVNQMISMHPVGQGVDRVTAGIAKPFRSKAWRAYW